MSAPGLQTCDLIVDNGYLVTMDEERREIAGGAIAVKDRRIAALGPAGAIARSWRAARRIDAGGALVGRSGACRNQGDAQQRQNCGVTGSHEPSVFRCCRIPPD